MQIVMMLMMMVMELITHCGNCKVADCGDNNSDVEKNDGDDDNGGHCNVSTNIKNIADSDAYNNDDDR